MLKKGLITAMWGLFFVFALSYESIEVNAVSQEVNEQFNEQETEKTIYGPELTALNVEPDSVIGTIAVFIGGYLAAHIIDGVIEYVTGQEPGDWVTDAMDWVGSGVSELYGIHDSIDYGLSADGCVRINPESPWTCPFGVID